MCSVKSGVPKLARWSPSRRTRTWLAVPPVSWRLQSGRSTRGMDINNLGQVHTLIAVEQGIHDATPHGRHVQCLGCCNVSLCELPSGHRVDASLVSYVALAATCCCLAASIRHCFTVLTFTRHLLEPSSSSTTPPLGIATAMFPRGRWMTSFSKMVLIFILMIESSCGEYRKNWRMRFRVDGSWEGNDDLP